MNLETIKQNYNRGRLSFEEINWLMNTVEQLQEENEAMAEKHADKDMAIQEMARIIRDSREENKRLYITICQLRSKTRFKVFEENLELAQENARLNARLKELVQI